ncbi:MAG TPA: NAD-dependent epimerase/dehydratase family protein [Pirellulales bacterium]|nr:NAD-dependent epimerase/dehydratase family protein [Pirellulales bacterium]
MARERNLVTGATGFVGACLTRALIDAGHDVHVTLRAASSPWRLAGLEGRYVAHQADLRDLAAVRRAVEAARPQVVYHLAAHGALYHERDRAAILASNLLGTCNLLEALDDCDDCTLVQTGSSSEYGHKAHPMREDDRLEPRTDYAVSKAAATLLCQAAAYEGRSVATVRIFSAYGPWEDPSRLVPYVMACCLRGERPRVTSGEQPRDFIYVDDCIELLQLAAHAPAARGQILHAASGRRQTVREMVETIVETCSGGRLSAEYGGEPLRPDEPTTWVGSIERTNELTGWRPRYDLPSGVERTWAWRRRFAAQAA